MRYAVDLLALLALVSTTAALIGVWRAPDLFARIRASNQTLFTGVLPLVLAVACTTEAAVGVRAALLGLFLVLTTTVSAHVIARAGIDRARDGRDPGQES